MMYSVGDKVVHPNYGPGVIKEVERRQIIGDERRYYVIDMLAHQGGTLMTPVAQADEVGLRPVIGDARLRRLLKVAAEESVPLPEDFRDRQTEVEEHLGEGDLAFAAEVVRDLAGHGRRVRKLTNRETQIMQKAEQLLAGEMALVQEIEIKEALDRVRAIVVEAARERAIEAEAALEQAVP